jgi:hypothetical protein
VQLRFYFLAAIKIEIAPSNLFEGQLMEMFCPIFSGDCCWVLYGRKKYHGRRTVIGGNIKIRRLNHLGRSRNRIRSVRRFDNCDVVL